MYTFLIAMLIVLSLLLYLGFRALFENKHDRINAYAVKFALNRVIKRNRLSISEIDSLGNRVIALDRTNNKIILIEHRNNVTWEKCLSLWQLESCKINKGTDPITGCTQEVVMDLSLNGNKKLVYFTFYDKSIDSLHELPRRIRKANNWKNKIQRHVNRVKAGHRLEYAL